jgi:hypothetical protein
LGKKHGFPVFDNAQAYVATTRVKIQGIPPGSSAEALILRLQPYDAAQRAIRTKDPIYILDALDVIDKHRLLLLIGSSIRAQSIRYGPMVSFEVFPKNRGTIAEEGAEVFRVVQAFANQPPMDVEIHPSFDIAFREPEVIEGQPIIPILEELINSTRQVVGLFGSVFPQ